MSTSCIFALYDADTKDYILLEKTHDGFREEVEKHIAEIENKDLWDIEDIANYFVKNFDYDIAIYSHKYPCYAYVYVLQSGKEYKFLESEIDRDIESITDCLPDIQKSVISCLGEDKVAVMGKIKDVD